MIRSTAVMAVVLLACLCAAPAFSDAARPRALLQDRDGGLLGGTLGRLTGGAVDGDVRVRGTRVQGFVRAGRDADAGFDTGAGGPNGFAGFTSNAGIRDRGVGISAGIDNDGPVLRRTTPRESERIASRLFGSRAAGGK